MALLAGANRGVIHHSVRLLDPPTLLTPGLARMLLRNSGRIELECQGFAWWPSPKHAERIVLFRYDPVAASPELETGELVLLAGDGGTTDLQRVGRAARRGDGADAETPVEIYLDADPMSLRQIPRSAILARSGATPGVQSSPAAGSGAAGSVERWLARAQCAMRPLLSRLLAAGAPLRESAVVRLDLDGEPALSVRSKYDEQALGYARRGDHRMVAAALGFLSALPAGSRVLVGGCGTGPDLAELATAKCRVTGIDFSFPMLAGAASRRELTGSGLVAMDLRRPAFRAASFDAIYLTEHVYSFVPRRESRIEMLRSLRAVVRRDGWILFTARSLERLLNRLRLLHYAATRAGDAAGPAEWGDSFTSYIARDGYLYHSFVHLFPEGEVRRELEQAGWRSPKPLGPLWIAQA